MARAGPSSSRRRLQSEEQEDQEMHDATQNGNGNGDQGSDDDQDQEEEEEEEEEESTQRRKAADIVAELKPQPLDLNSGNALKTLTSSYTNFVTTLEGNLNQLKEAVIATEDHKVGEEFDPEDDQIFKDSDLEAREMLDLIAEAQCRERAFKQIHAKLNQGEVIRDVNDLYSEMIEKEMAVYRTKTSRQKYLKSQAYEDFRNSIWEPRRDDRGPMPSLPELIPQEEGDEDDDSDDEIRVGNIIKDYKCPITTILLVDPVTNTNCKHSYSKAAIIDLINSKEKRCPVSGCMKEVTKSSIKENKSLNKQVQQHKRRMEAKEESRRATQNAGAAIID